MLIWMLSACSWLCLSHKTEFCSKSASWLQLWVHRYEIRACDDTQACLSHHQFGINPMRNDTHQRFTPARTWICSDCDAADALKRLDFTASLHRTIVFLGDLLSVRLNGMHDLANNTAADRVNWFCCSSKVPVVFLVVTYRLNIWWHGWLLRRSCSLRMRNHNCSQSVGRRRLKISHFIWKRFTKPCLVSAASSCQVDLVHRLQSKYDHLFSRNLI